MKASSSLSTERDHTKIAAVRLISAEAGRELENARAAFQVSQKCLQSAHAEQTAREAYFAQSQLLKFIQSGRRELTPLNVAMAMAGLPRVSARVSCERCSAWKHMTRPGHAYLMFQAIENAFKKPPAEEETAREKMRAHLMGPLRKNQDHIAEMRRNWYFLNAAIESVYPTHCYPRGSIPYRIFAKYKGLMMARSSVDILLAEMSHL